MRIRKRSSILMVVLAIVLFVIGTFGDLKATDQTRRKNDSYSDGNFLEPASQTIRNITVYEPFSWFQINLNATSKLLTYIKFEGETYYSKNESQLQNSFLLNDAGKWTIVFQNNNSERVHYEYNLVLTTATTQPQHLFAWVLPPTYLAGEIMFITILPITFYDDIKRKWNKTTTEILAFSAVAILIFGATPVLSLMTGVSQPVVSPTSGSMRPTIYPGDLVIVGGASNSSLSVGDIIVYDQMVINLSAPVIEPISNPIMHRIAEILYQNGTLYFQTKGDNNPTADEWYVPQKGIQGKAILVIPYLGSLVLALSQLQVKIIVIAIIIVAIIVWPSKKNKKNRVEGEKK